MTGGRARLSVGLKFLYDGDLVSVVELHAQYLMIRGRSVGKMVVGIREFFAHRPVLYEPGGPAQAADAAANPVTRMSSAEIYSGLTPQQQRQLTSRIECVQEVLTGYRSGAEELARPDEPRPDYAPSTILKQRKEAMAAELGIRPRTIERWITAYRDGDPTALVDGRSLRLTDVLANIDERWVATAQSMIDEYLNSSTPVKAMIIRRVEARISAEVGPDDPPVQIPGKTVAYAALTELARGRNTFSGSAKGRRSIASRPSGTYGKLRATRIGEVLVLDTTRYDVFGMDRVTKRWVRIELTVAMDLCCRGVAGLRMTPVSTTSVDAASVLYDAMVATPVPDSWPPGVGWPYYGAPDIIAVDPDKYDPGNSYGKPSKLITSPVLVPEAILIDHGKIYFSEHIRGVCRRFGTDVRPARVAAGYDKGWLERFFRTIREQFLAELPGYKGPDVYSRGKDSEAETFYYIDELEAMLREWIATVYHVQPHDGLVEPNAPGVAFSPIEMYEHATARFGHIEFPTNPDLAYEFLPIEWRSIQHYGVNAFGLVYNGDALNDYRNVTSPYPGPNSGKWPFRYLADDISRLWFQDPKTGEWNEIPWEHANAVGGPFSREALDLAKKLAATTTRHNDPAVALRQLLDKWGAGLADTPQQRRLALRHSREIRDALGVEQALPHTVTRHDDAWYSNYRGVGVAEDTGTLERDPRPTSPPAMPPQRADRDTTARSRTNDSVDDAWDDPDDDLDGYDPDDDDRDDDDFYDGAFGTVE